MGLFFTKYSNADYCPRCNTLWTAKIGFPRYIIEPPYLIQECSKCRSPLNHINKDEQKTYYVLRGTKLHIKSDCLKLLIVWLPSSAMFILGAMSILDFFHKALYVLPIFDAWVYTATDITVLGYDSSWLAVLARFAAIYYILFLIIWFLERHSSLKHKRELDIRNGKI